MSRHALTLLLATQLFACTALVESELDQKSGESERDASVIDRDASADRDAGAPDPEDADTPAEDSGEPPSNGPAENEGARLTFGRSHVCAQAKDGRTACWGDDSEGQLGIPAGTYLDVAAGFEHTCAIKADGSLVCEGKNSSAQSVSDPGPFKRVTAGNIHTCALAPNGSARCFSKDNFDGLLDVPNELFSSISAGEDFTCGIRTSDSALRCWGKNASAYQSDAQGLKFKSISTATGLVCGVQDSDEPICFGARFLLDGGEPVVAIDVGANGACALTSSGKAVCGANAETDLNSRFSEELLAGSYVALAVSRSFGVDAGAFCAIPRRGAPVCDSPRLPSLRAVPTDLLP